MFSTEERENELKSAIIEIVRREEKLTASDIVNLMSLRHGVAEFDTREMIWNLISEHRLGLTPNRFLRLASEE